MRYGDVDGGPVGPVRDLQRALLADGRKLPKYGDDGQLGAEGWHALTEAALDRGFELAREDDVPPALLAELRVDDLRPTDRRVPIETRRRWPSFGARAWLAERAEGARLHAGVDLGGSHDLVVAPERLRVERVIEASYGGRTPRFSRPLGWGGYGPHAVLLRAVSGGEMLERWHLLAHVDRVVVREGQILELGAPVAQVSPVGAHLHWEVRSEAAPTGGASVVEIVLDPGDWIFGCDRVWTHGVDPCPRKPERTARTPRPCRPRG